MAYVFTVQNIDSVPDSPAPPREITPLEIDIILTKDVQRYLDKRDVNKSAGPDKLSPRLSLSLASVVTKAQTYSRWFCFLLCRLNNSLLV